MRRKNKGVNITFFLYPARRLPMLAPPHSNRNLVGIAGEKAKNKPFPTISTEN